MMECRLPTTTDTRRARSSPGTRVWRQVGNHSGNGTFAGSGSPNSGTSNDSPWPHPLASPSADSGSRMRMADPLAGSARTIASDAAFSRLEAIARSARRKMSEVDRTIEEGRAAGISEAELQSMTELCIHSRRRETVRRTATALDRQTVASTKLQFALSSFKPLWQEVHNKGMITSLVGVASKIKVLDEAIARCRLAGLPESDLKGPSAELAEVRLAAAQGRLRLAIQNGNMKELTAIIEEGRHAGLSSAEMDHAKQALHKEEQRLEVMAMIEHAVDAGDADKLREAIQQGKAINVDANALKLAIHTLGEFRWNAAAEDRVKKAVETRSVNALETAIRIGQTAGVGVEELCAAKQVLAEEKQQATAATSVVELGRKLMAKAKLAKAMEGRERNDLESAIDEAMTAGLEVSEIQKGFRVLAQESGRFVQEIQRDQIVKRQKLAARPSQQLRGRGFDCAKGREVISNEKFMMRMDSNFDSQLCEYAVHMGDLRLSAAAAGNDSCCAMELQSEDKAAPLSCPDLSVLPSPAKHSSAVGGSRLSNQASSLEMHTAARAKARRNSRVKRRNTGSMDISSLGNYAADAVVNHDKLEDVATCHIVKGCGSMFKSPPDVLLMEDGVLEVHGDVNPLSADGIFEESPDLSRAASESLDETSSHAAAETSVGEAGERASRATDVQVFNGEHLKVEEELVADTQKKSSLISMFSDDEDSDDGVPRPSQVDRQTMRHGGRVASILKDRVKLKINIVSATGLRAADWLGKSDPYCTCKLAGKPETEFRTEVTMKSLNPVWNHEGTLNDVTVTDSLEFYVLDWNKLMQPSPLGNMSLDAHQFIVNGFSGTVQLEGAGAKQNAKLHVIVQVINPESEAAVNIQSRVRGLQARKRLPARVEAAAVEKAAAEKADAEKADKQRADKAAAEKSGIENKNAEKAAKHERDEQAEETMSQQVSAQDSEADHAGRSISHSADLQADSSSQQLSRCKANMADADACAGGAEALSNGPRERLQQWKVILDRSQGDPLGMHFDMGKMTVMSLSLSGLVVAWNLTHECAAVRPGDKVVRVNDHIEVQAMIAECQKLRVLDILLERVDALPVSVQNVLEADIEQVNSSSQQVLSVVDKTTDVDADADAAVVGGPPGSSQRLINGPFQWNVTLDRSTGESLGMHLDTRTMNVTCLSWNGLVVAWNLDNENASVCPGDKVVRVNEQSEPQAMVAECQKLQVLDILIERMDAGSGSLESVHSPVDAQVNRSPRQVCLPVDKTADGEEQEFQQDTQQLQVLSFSSERENARAGNMETSCQSDDIQPDGSSQAALSSFCKTSAFHDAVAPASSDGPRERLRHWQVTLDRSEGEQLGMRLDIQTMTVMSLSWNGLVVAWNLDNEHASVRPGDKVISVNKQSDPRAMVMEIQKLSMLEVLFERVNACFDSMQTFSETATSQVGRLREPADLQVDGTSEPVSLQADVSLQQLSTLHKTDNAGGFEGVVAEASDCYYETLQQFRVTFDRSNGEPLGMRLDTNTMTVMSLSWTGLVVAWNLDNARMSVRPGDKVISVNNQFERQEIVAECQKLQVLNIVIERVDARPDSAGSVSQQSDLHVDSFSGQAPQSVSNTVEASRDVGEVAGVNLSSPMPGSPAGTVESNLLPKAPSIEEGSDKLLALESFVQQKGTSRVGVIIKIDARDDMPYKVHFDDGGLPADDWFSGDAIEICQLKSRV